MMRKIPFQAKYDSYDKKVEFVIEFCILIIFILVVRS